MKNLADEVFAIVGAIATIVIFIFIAPWLCFWIAYFGGWIAKITIGNYLVQGLHFIHIDIVKDQIPLLAGIFGWIGGFIKNTSSSVKGQKG